MHSKAFYISLFFVAAIHAQSFDELLKEVLASVEQINEALFKPSVKDSTYRSNIPAGAYIIKIEVATPLINQFNQLLKKIKHPDIQKPPEMPEFLPIWSKTVNLQQLTPTLNELLNRLQKSSKYTLLFKVDFGNPEDLFLFYKTPFNPLTDEYLIASSRTAFEEGAEPGFLERYIQHSPALYKQLATLQTTLEKVSTTADQSTFFIEVEGPYSTVRAEFDPSRKQLASHLYTLLTHQKHSQEPTEESKEVAID